MTLTILDKPVQYAEVDPVQLGTSTRVVIAYLDLGFALMPVGALTWDPNTLAIENLYVPETFQRQGLATALLAAARTLEPAITPSAQRSLAGDAWAASMTAGVPGVLPPNTDPLDQREAVAIGARLMVGLGLMDSTWFLGAALDPNTPMASS